jgi:hypothetical protein
LAAPQLLPTLELQQLSVRSQERDFDFLTKNSLPATMLLNLLIPSAFGNNVTGFEGGDPFQEDFIYAGFIPLLFVCFSFRQRRRDLLFFVLLLLAGVGLALGRYTPLYHYLIQYLPGFALFRIPARWLMVVNLALAILAGFGLETRLQNGLSKSHLSLILATGALIIISLGLLWSFRDSLQSWSHERWGEFHHKLLTAFFTKAFRIDPIYQNRLLLSRVIGLTMPVALLVANILVASILFTLYAARKIGPVAWSRLLVAALATDLVIAGGVAINPIQPGDWWQRLSPGGQFVVEHVGAARVFPLGMGSEQATVSHLGQYFPSVYRVRSAGGHGSSLMLDRLRIFLKEAHPVQAIQVLGVRYLLTEGQLGADAAATYPLAFSDETAFVYENKSPLPRAFVVHEAIPVNSLAEAMAYLKGASIDPGRTVILETAQPLTKLESPPTTSTAVIVDENSQLIRVEVEAATAGYLVLLDTFYPGWVATVDGQATPIYPANVIGRAIFIPAGQHIVLFKYQPLSFRVALWLSAATLLILGGLGLICYYAAIKSIISIKRLMRPRLSGNF